MLHKNNNEKKFPKPLDFFWKPCRMVNVVIDIDKEIEMFTIALVVVLSLVTVMAVFGGASSSSVKSLG